MNFFRQYFYTRVNLDSTNRKFYLIFFTLIIAFIFLNFIEPFGLYYDSELSGDEVFIELSIALLIAFCILLFSQFVLRSLLKLTGLKLLSHVGWFLLEAILVGTTWSLFDYIEDGNTTSFFANFTDNIIAYILIMFVPYFGFITITLFKDLMMESKEIKKQLENNSGQYIEDISFKDENNTVRFISKTLNILFIQSSDNYVDIHYLEDNTPRKTLLRNSIKRLEEQLVNTPVIRCHRSFMINTQNIETASKTAAGFEVKLTASDTKIPVSKSYLSEIKKFL